MTPVVTNQQSGASGMYVGLFYLLNPPLGAQTVKAWLGAAGGTTDVECSATTWTGVTGIDASIVNTNQDMHGSATSLALNPKTTVPANEVFFGALFLIVWACSGCGPSRLYVSYPASIVDDNLNVGSGSNHGCQALPNSPDYECIGSAQLPSGGTSMAFSWTYGAFVVAAGFGIQSSSTLWAPGYMGNEIYMTEGLQITSNPLFIYPGSYVSAGEANPYGATYSQYNANAMYLALGQDPRTPQSSTIEFSEVYLSNGHAMFVYVPVAAVGAMTMNADYYTVGCEGLYLSIYNSPGASTSMIGSTTNFDSGINVTGNVGKGNTKSPDFWDLALDVAGQLPVIGYVVDLGQGFMSFENLVGAYSSSDAGGGANTASLLWNVQNGSYQPSIGIWQDVYSAQNVVSVQLSNQTFASPTPGELVFSAENLMTPYLNSCGGAYADGATAEIIMYAYPAGAI